MSGFGAVAALTFLFIAINALFVAAEFALIASPRASLERRAQRGDRVARHLLDVLESPRRQDRYVATAQLGVTLASLGLGMYGEHTLAHLIEPWLGDLSFISAAAIASTLALAALTVLHIVLGEMLPKSIALQNPERVGWVSHWPMTVTLALLYPLVAASNWLARLCLRLIGIRRDETAREQVYTPEELQLIVEESERGGAGQGESGRLLRELFEFGDHTAAQVMVPRVHVIGIPVGASPDALRRLVVEHRRTRYPVYEGDLDHIVGMLHVKELLRRLIAREPVAAGDVRRIPVIPETAALDDVLTTMQRARAHMAVVIDEHGGTAGIVNLEDLFEEVVGELDEGVPAEPPIAPEGKDVVRAAGTVRLDELGQHFDVELHHEDVESVSGLVLAELGRPPVVGDVVDYGRVRFEVTEVSGRGVKEVRATLLNEDDTASPRA
jgi:CBS domain containing-hemolysin-like protein